MLPSILAIVFGGVLLFFLIMSVILNYHWTRYGLGRVKLYIVRFVYFGVSAAILGIAAIFFTRAIS